MQNALNYYNQTLPLYRALKDKEGEFILLVNIGAVYIALGKTQSAIDNFLLALPIVKEINNPRAEAIILNNIGGGFDDLGEYQKAIDYLNQSLALRRKTGDRNGEAISLANIAIIYSKLGDQQKALEFLNQALTVQRELKARGMEAYTLNSIGRIYLEQRDYQKSFEYYSASLTIRREVGDIFGESITLFSLAHVERGRGNLNEARILIENAIQIIESVRATLASEDLRSSFFAANQDIYKFHIDVLMRLHAKQPDKGFDALALQASEHARARSLLDLLAEARIDIRQGIEAKLLDRERALQKQLNAKDEERRGTKNAPQAEALDKEIRTLTTQYQELQAEIKLKSPRYAALTQPKPADLKEIQQMLDADTILLEYSLGSDKSYLWAVSQNELKSFVLPKSKFENMLNKFALKGFVATAMMFLLFALSGNFAAVNAQSSSWKLKEIKVFTKMTGYSAITSESYNQDGGNVEVNVNGNALGMCPGGSEKMGFAWSFEGDAAEISNGGTVTVNLQAGVLSVGKPCTGATIAQFSSLSIYGGGGSSPLSAEENKLIDSDRFRRMDDQYYVFAADGRKTSTTSLKVSEVKNFNHLPLAYFDFTIGTRAGDSIRYVYIYESVGNDGTSEGGLSAEQINLAKQWIAYYDDQINKWIQYRDYQVLPYWNDATYYQWARNEYAKCNESIQTLIEYKAYYQNQLRQAGQL